MKQLFLLLLLIPNLLLGQCAGNQSYTLTPAPTNNTYQPGTIVTLSYTMQDWNGTNFGSNWLEGFGLTFGPGWASYAPLTTPIDCNGGSAGEQWLWMPSVTSSSTGLTVGPGYFYEGPTGPLDGNPGNDWGDFGTDCAWTFEILLQVTDQCDPVSLSIAVTPYADGSMGSWGNESCFDSAFQIFNGTVAGGDVDTSPISVTTDTTCTSYTRVYSVASTPGSTYNWQLSGGGTLSASGNNVCQVAWDTPGNYIISVQETTADGCIGPIVDTTITVVLPVIDLGTPYAVCPNTNIVLFASPSNGTWSGFNIQDDSFLGTDPGLYYATYTADVFGCIVTDSISITVTQPPITHSILNNGTNLDFCIQSYVQSYYMPDEPGVVYTWHVDGVLQNDDDFELQMTWPDSTMYHTIMVHGTDSVGCVGEESYLAVTTKACHRLYVPNSFTPNGDGFNDALRVAGLSVYNLNFKIYNRFGQHVYTIISTMQAWNGDSGNGYYCENGVYNWIATYTDDFGFNHMERGHITLIR